MSQLLTTFDQWRLAQDDSTHVRACVALNPHLLPEVQDALAVDHHAVVRTALASHRALAADAAARIAQDAVAAVRQRLAENPGIPIAAQRILVQDADDAVGEALARNPCLVADIQRCLAVDCTPRVRVALLRNPVLCRGALKVLLRGLAGECGEEGPQQSLASSDVLDPSVRPTPFTLEHPVIGPILALVTKASDVHAAAIGFPDPLVRLGLAANPHVGAEVWRSQLGDEDPDVRATAARRVLGVLAGL